MPSTLDTAPTEDATVTTLRALSARPTTMVELRKRTGIPLVRIATAVRSLVIAGVVTRDTFGCRYQLTMP